MISRGYIARHMSLVAIVVFLVSFMLLHAVKPSFMYNEDGSLRPIGLGFSRRTAVPAWFASLLMSILSYVAVMYYVSAPRFA